ncbi:MAG: nucleotide sugar dehydrogenase [Candidatus Thorarchaeota archaeon]
MTKGTLAVVGLGYVGLPVAAKFAEAGFDVTGIDIVKEKVDMINAGQCPIAGDEPNLPELIEKVIKEGSLKATLSHEPIKSADYIIIVVETPFDLPSREPYYSALRSASTSVGQNLSKGSLVIVESTVAPGTVNSIVKPILETESGLKAGDDFMLATAPERVMPGKLLYNLTNLNRTIGGFDKKSTETALKFYSEIVKGELYPTDILTAEVVKTTENAYRDVQIAFANEIALLCENMGVDVYEVRELVNKSPFRQMHLPGAGVGGHCLPKDSWLLAFGARGGYTPRLLATAREINDGMPRHLSHLCEDALKDAGRGVYGSRITVLGIAYLENSDDTRNSPSFTLIKALEVLGAHPVPHDPYVRAVKEIHGMKPLDDLYGALKDSDCMVLVTAHDEYSDIDLDKAKSLMRTPVIVDGRKVFDKDKCMKKGFIFRAIGR